MGYLCASGSFPVWKESWKTIWGDLSRIFPGKEAMICHDFSHTTHGSRAVTTSAADV